MTNEIVNVPEIGGKLRSKNILKLPEAISKASGIIVNGRKIRSFVFVFWTQTIITIFLYFK